MKNYNLDSRFEDFAASIITIYDKPSKSFASDYLAKQLIRSSCSAALNFGEAMGAGTDKDKANKLRICLKELRESIRNLNIQTKAKLYSDEFMYPLKKENDELIRIIVTLLKNLN
ncbi:MAG: four helix bundle protein [Aequorivita sp.]